MIWGIFVVFGVVTLVRLWISWQNLAETHQLKLSGEFATDSNWPLLSILIPVRNEEAEVDALVDHLKKLQYPNLEVCMYDDCSTDRTNARLQKSIEHMQDFKLITASHLPEGWLGKNFACAQLALQAKGDYLLFLDADVRVTDAAIFAAIGQMRREQLAMLSVFPKQSCISWSERILVPIIHHILLSWLPLSLVQHSRFPSLAAANGQFMCFQAEVYQKHQWHAQMPKLLVEDVAIARALKSWHYPISCKLSANGLVSCRMYPNAGGAVPGLAKSMVAGLGGNSLLLLSFVLLTTAVWLLLLWSVPLGSVILLSLHILSRIFVARASGDCLSDTLLLYLPQQLSWHALYLYAVYAYQFKKLKWKDRFVLS